jgi:mRNA interferase RelE/StbE
MASYSIRFKASAEKELRGLPKSVLDRVLERIDGLKSDPFPHGSRKLTDAEGLYRIRIGDYRVVYGVDVPGTTVTIQYIRHRSQVYRDL